MIFVSFNVGPVKTLLQSERYTLSEFLSLCGGLLGLFLGVSALSIIDLAYHFTLRLFWTIRHQKRHQNDPISEDGFNSHATQNRSLSEVGKRDIPSDLFYVSILFLLHICNPLDIEGTN